MLCSALGWTRTSNRRIRSPVLYPFELRGQCDEVRSLGFSPTDASVLLMVNDLDRPGGKLRVLLAEDNALNQKVMLAFLQLLECETTAVIDGLSAYEQIDSGDFDVALVDIQLPGQTGLELVTKVRTEMEGKAPVLVAVTAMARSDGTDYYGALGFDAYLGKPVSMKDLSALLAGIGS